MNGILNKLKAIAGGQDSGSDMPIDEDMLVAELHADMTIKFRELYEADPDYCIKAVGSHLVTAMEARRMQVGESRSDAFSQEYKSDHRDMVVHVGAIK